MIVAISEVSITVLNEIDQVELYWIMAKNTIEVVTIIGYKVAAVDSIIAEIVETKPETGFHCFNCCCHNTNCLVAIGFTN